MKSAKFFLCLFLLLPLAAAPSAVPPAVAQARDPDTDTTPVRGPADVALGRDVLLALPKSYVFLPRLATARLMVQMGNLVTDNLLGMVVDGSADWMTMIDYSAAGHVPDAEALDAAALLARMRAQALREQKETRNVAHLYPGRWIEAPRYDKARHILTWSIELQTIEKGKVVRTSINTNAAKLGRRGYVILGLATEPQDLARFRTHLTTLASSIRFRPGQDYADFDKGRDKAASHGLTGLIAE